MKLAKHHNLWLALCVLVLAVMCYMSISAPIKFKVYTGDFNVLIKGGYLADSLQYIPFSDGKRFDLAATVQVSKSGRQLPLAECGATYDTYLNGLDENSIANLIEKANERGRYAGIRMGDIAAGDTQLSINK